MARKPTARAKGDKIVNTKVYPRAFATWTASEDRKVLDMFQQGKTMREIAAATQRHPDAIKTRLIYMNVM
jgi:DNA-binding NarL/FixJ family response regulator